jgi:hypothetical protein
MSRLALSEDAPGLAVTATWIGPLVALGARAWRYWQQSPGRQLIIVISVPRRDFAAVLVSCGWAMVHPAPVLSPPIEVLRHLKPLTPLRVVTDSKVVTGHFSSLDERRGPARVQVGKSAWFVDRIEALHVLPESEEPERANRPTPGSAARYARLDGAWSARLACPPADLAIIGTLAWLREEISACLSQEGDQGDPSLISTLLLPKGAQAATWSTRLYSSASLDDYLPLPADVRAAVLDGTGAIRYLAGIEAPVVTCVIDRSVADEAAAEIVVQLRNTRGNPVSMNDLGWQSVPGIEALAFTVPL